PSADVADHHRVAEPEAQETRGVDAWIEAGDHEQAQVREYDRTLVTAGGGERAVALERDVDARRARLIGTRQLKSGRLPELGCGCQLVVSHGISSPVVWYGFSRAPRPWRVGQRAPARPRRRR